MLNQTNDWVFVKKPSRPALSDREVSYWKQQLKKLLKVGVEVELNLPDKNGSCDRQNFFCECQAVFEAPDPMPQTSKCYEQCQKWNNGQCKIAQEQGCSGVFCAAFEQPCSNCSKFDRGCDSCPELYSLRKDPNYIREAVGKALNPTRFVGSHGDNGIYKVCRDGSLLGDGGIEVATVGRRVQFGPLYEMVHQIMSLCEEYGAYVNERCSIHVHLLASYLNSGFDENDKGSEYVKKEITELERPVPEIIIANFHQLVRRYQCALIWLSASGESPKRLTRWEKFRKSILPYSAARDSMFGVTQSVGSASKSKRKYGLINYEQMGFDDNGQVSRLHIEGRYMDGNLSPATVVAHACLLYGLMLKAVEISRYGVLISGNKQYLDLQNEIYKNLCNNDGSWDSDRHSDTSKLDPYIPDLKRQSRQLIRLVKTTLAEQAPADEILRKLADEPLAYHRIDGKDWKDIEAHLIPEPPEPSELELDISKMVDIGAICECETHDEWVEAIAYQLGLDRNITDSEASMEEFKDRIAGYVSHLSTKQQIFWSEDVGGYVRRQ